MLVHINDAFLPNVNVVGYTGVCPDSSVKMLHGQCVILYYLILYTRKSSRRIVSVMSDTCAPLCYDDTAVKRSINPVVALRNNKTPATKGLNPRVG